MTGQKQREIAARILSKRDRGEDFIENLAERELAAAQATGPDRALIVEISYGAVRRQRTLDFLIDRKTQGRQQKPLLQILLRLGLYQIFFLERIPEHAAVHETVEAAKNLGFGPQAGFVNAVLRGYIRERDQTLALLRDLETTRPDIAHSHPEWLWKKWSARYGENDARELLRLNNTPPPTYARCNTLRATHDQLTAAWRAENVDFKAHAYDWAPLVYELLSHPPLATLDSFKNGFFYLQDPSTLLAPKELSAQPGQSILDLCAAPGGKTTYLAQLLSNQSRIVAEDAQPARLEMVRANAARLGAQIQIGAAPNEKFDRILIDAPCSNTGVLRRRVELRWRLNETEFQRLTHQQQTLLESATQRLNPNGAILYSTCSLETEENESLIQLFLSTHPQFRLEQERSLLPHRDKVDGAYIARLTPRT